MLIPFNTFTIHSLVSFIVTISLAVMFYIVYFKAGRRLIDLLAANFVLFAALLCLDFFISDNLIPAGMSAYGWAGGPTAAFLKSATLEINRLTSISALMFIAIQLHFVLCYTQKRNFLRRHIRWVYGLCALVIPTAWVFPSVWLVAPDAPMAETASWLVTIPWLPVAGPGVSVLGLSFIALQVYGLILLWRTRKTSLAQESSESLGARNIVFAAFVFQMLASVVDATNASMGLAVPAAGPIGSGIMGILLAIAMTRSRVEADRLRFQLAGEKDALLECVPQPLLYFGNDHRIQWANNNAAGFANKQTGELVGSKTADIWGGEAEETLPVEQALATGKPARREIVRHQDETTWIVNASPVRGATGKINGAIELATDITEIRKAQRALRESNTRIIMAREEERRRVAQDLHDSIAQGLTAMQMQTEVEAQKVGKDTPEGYILHQASQKAAQLGTEVRQISHQLYPPALDLLGLVKALEDIFDQYRPSGVDCGIEAADEMSRMRFSQGAEVALYRTVQEAMSNAVRHGQATKVTVGLTQNDGDIRLTVTDNGCGFDVEANSRGLGMTSMGSRIDGIGGKLDLASRPGHTCIGVTVPLKHIAAETAASTAS